MHAYYEVQTRLIQTREVDRPRELVELSARIDRLRQRLRHGDPDMTADELQAAIERAEGKRRELEGQRSDAAGAPAMLSILPKAAAMFREKVARGLEGNSEATLKARTVPRELVGGQIDLKKEGGELWAEYSFLPAALLQSVGYRGSGGRIWTVPSVPQSLRVK
jgi:site-specific DNA recombinase